MNGDYIDHLARWTQQDDDGERAYETFTLIADYLARLPMADVDYTLANHSWPEIRDLALATDDR